MKHYLAQAKTDFLWLLSILVINALAGFLMLEFLGNGYSLPGFPAVLLFLINIGICAGYAKHNFSQTNYAFLEGKSRLRIARKTWLFIASSGGIGYYLPLVTFIFLRKHYQAPFGRPDMHSYFFFDTELSYWVVTAVIGIVCFGVIVPTVANLLIGRQLCRDSSF